MTPSLHVYVTHTSCCDDASCTSIQIPKVDACNPIKGVSEDHAIHMVGYNLSEWMQTVDFVVATTFGKYCTVQ